MIVCALTSSAQTYMEHIQTRETGKGNVTVYQSKEIDDLVNGNTNTKDLQLQNKKTENTPVKKDPTTRPLEALPKKQANEDSEPTDITTIDTSKKVMRNVIKVTGYRVQVYAGGNSRSDKIKAESIGNKIKSQFPEQPVYVHFYSPRWICRMGNFRSYNEAQSMLEKVKEAGYRQASLVKGKITVAY